MWIVKLIKADPEGRVEERFNLWQFPKAYERKSCADLLAVRIRGLGGEAVVEADPPLKPFPTPSAALIRVASSFLGYEAFKNPGAGKDELLLAAAAAGCSDEEFGSLLITVNQHPWNEVMGWLRGIGMIR